MPAGDASFAGSIPGIYDQYRVPLLFGPCAQDLVERVADLQRGRLIELAAGCPGYHAQPHGYAAAR